MTFFFFVKSFVQNNNSDVNLLFDFFESPELNHTDNVFPIKQTM